MQNFATSKFVYENRVRSKASKIFHETWLKYKALLAEVQRTRTVTPPSAFAELCPEV